MSEREWGVMHAQFPEELHRGPWSEQDAREWIEEAETDGFRPGAFQLVSREVGAWEVQVFRCVVPPVGWSCSRGSGHEGPCAASPWPEDPRLEELDLDIR